MPGAGTIPRFLWPIIIDSSNGDLRAVIDGGAAFVATIPAGTYYWSGNGQADDMAEALSTELSDGPDGWAVAVTINTDGTITLSCDPSIELSWAHASTTLSPALCGFIAATKSDAGGDLDSDFQAGCIWNPETETIRDSEDRPQYGVALAESCEGQIRVQRWKPAQYVRDVEVDLMPGRKIFSAEETLQQEAFERFYAYLSTGGRFRLIRDLTSIPTVWSACTYVIRERRWLEEWPVQRPEQLVRLFTITFPLRRYVA